MLVFFELLVTHSNDFGVEGHLIHVLHIVMLFIELSLSLGKETLSPLIRFNLNLSRWKLRAPGTVRLHHLLFTSLGSCLLLGLLLLADLLLVLDLHVRLDLCGGLHSCDVSCGNNGSGASCTFTSLLNVSSHGSEIVIVNKSNVSIGRLGSRGCEESKMSSYR